ncbi:hypothetical protein Tco_1050488 [Tanacetum coccineum]
MASMKYCDKHNQVGFLKKPEESTGFAEIVDFLKGSTIRQETEIPQSQDPTHPHVAEKRPMTVDDLLQLVTKLITKVDSLEKELKQTKQTMGKAIMKLVKKEKKMEAVLKRGHVVLTNLEDEDAENSSKQGRNLQEEGINTGFIDVNTAFEEINSGFTDVTTAFEEINSGDESIIPSSKKGQREGKAVLEEISCLKGTIRTDQNEQHVFVWLEIVRLQAQEEAENARKAKLQRQDALSAKRVQDEFRSTILKLKD